jgi:hypothetical protein
MGTSSAYLCQEGLPWPLAKHMGMTINTLTGVGTAQSGATLISGANFILLTTAGGATAFVLPANLEIGSSMELSNPSATTALIYPELGAQIQGGGANAAFSVVQNKVCKLTKIAALTWVANLSA